MEIKEMNLEQLSEQKEEIRSMLNNEDADLDALTARLDEIEARENEIKESAEKRNRLLEMVGKEGTVVETMTETTELRNGADSVEYRNAYCKELAKHMEGRNVFGEMTKEEREAFVFTTANTGAVVPTLILDRVKDLVSSMAPLYDDATKSALTEGFRLARHTAIQQGDAQATLEGIANDDEKDVFDYLPLPGVEIKKHADVTRKMRFQSIGAFEDW